MIGPKEARVTPAQSRAAYAKVAERSFGLCEGCGTRQATQMHHRVYRSRGGRDEVVNLLHLCSDAVGGNVDGCHGEAHNDPERQIHGWSVPSHEKPRDRPVLYRGAWVYLMPDGGLEPMGGVTW